MSGPINTSMVSGDGRPPVRETTWLPQKLSPEGLQDWGGAWVQRLRPDPVVDAKHVVLQKLAKYPGGGTLEDEDRLFAEHTWLVEQARDHKIPYSAPVDVWNYHLRGAAMMTEFRIGRPIHKGAPLYNCGLCHSLAGDFETAHYYLSEGAREEQRSRGDAESVLLSGDHKLSRQILVEPLVADVFPTWTADYTALTGKVLDAAEFIELLKWMFIQPADAVEVMLALHRLRALNGRENNATTRSQRAGIVRDLHHVVESALRAQGIGSGELYKRMEAALTIDVAAKTAFDALHAWRNNPANIVPADRDSAQALDLVVGEAFRVFGTAGSWQERAGTAGYTAVRVRNSVAHRNYEQSVVFTDPAKSDRLCAWALASCRTVKHSAEHTL